jgi:hypothetical protein
MAERGIHMLYKRVQRRGARIVIWCESPYQLATIPPMVTNIIQSHAWAEFVQQLDGAGPSETPAWEECWRAGWDKLRGKQIELLALQFLGTNRSTTHLRNRMLDSLQGHLKAITLSGRIPPGRLSVRFNQTPTEFELYEAPVNMDYFKTVLNSVYGVEHSVKLDSPLPILDVLWSAISPIDQKLEVLREFRVACRRIGEIGQRAFGMYGSFFHRNSSLMSVPFTLWMPYSAGPLAFATGLSYVDGESENAPWAKDVEFCAYLYHGALGYVFTDEICYACGKPLTLVVDGEMVPHNADGPVAEWPDGMKVYAWRGVQVEPDIILDKESVTPLRIQKTSNAEQRRVMLEVYGEARYIVDSGAEKVQEDECGELYRIEMPGDETLAMVRVRNSTPEPDGTYKHYFLRVPPTIRTAREGVAWTFAMQEKEYNPRLET